MSAVDPQAGNRPRPTIFLSYASEDRPAVKLIRDALPDCGLEVWYDESDLLGGDAWDQKIRRQIRDCDYFMPVISANTDARREGYFRREWRLAAERTLDMADDSVFLVPVVIDDTRETLARVPDIFRAVQWVRVPNGQPNAALEALCRRLVPGEPNDPPPQRTAKVPRTQGRPAPPRREFPAFPKEEAGQRTRFWLQVVGWTFQSASVAFLRLPKWLRILVYCWIAVLVLARGCTPSRHDTRKLSSGQVTHLARLRQPAQALNNAPANADPAEVAKLIAQTSTGLPASAPNPPGRQTSFLSVPFTASPADRAAHRLAMAVSARINSQLVLAHQGRITLSAIALSSLNPTAAATRARDTHSRFIVYGGISGRKPKLNLIARIVATANESVVWSKSYPVTGADPAQIAADTVAEVAKIERACAARTSLCAGAASAPASTAAAKSTGAGSP